MIHLTRCIIPSLCTACLPVSSHNQLHRFKPTTLLPNIPIPLHHHPRRSKRAHHKRPSKPPPQLRSSIDHPLKRKVRKRDTESPQCDLIHRRVVNVVCAVQSDDGAESRPGAEGAGAERSDARRGGAGVDLLGAGEGEVGLDAVAEGDDGDLVFD
jgi:hypothetical protein